MSKTISLPKDKTPLVLIGDVIKALRKLPNKCVDVVVTSPPYYKQRKYGVKGEIGQEKTPEEYIEKIVEVGNELRRVLKNTGSYFLKKGNFLALMNGRAKELDMANTFFYDAHGLNPSNRSTASAFK